MGLVVNASIVIVLGPAVRSHDLTLKSDYQHPTCLAGTYASTADALIAFPPATS
jgi:hypothetical protein